MLCHQSYQKRTYTHMITSARRHTQHTWLSACALTRMDPPQVPLFTMYDDHEISDNWDKQVRAVCCSSLRICACRDRVVPGTESFLGAHRTDQMMKLDDAMLLGQILRLMLELESEAPSEALRVQARDCMCAGEPSVSCGCWQLVLLLGITKPSVSHRMRVCCACPQARVQFAWINCLHMSELLRALHVASN
jgi:hypothetical protein